MNPSGLIRPYHQWLAIGMRLLDASIVVALLPLLTLAYDVRWSPFYSAAAILAALLTLLSMQAVDAYRPWRGDDFTSEMRTLFAGWMMVIVALLFLAWATKSTAIYSRLAVGTWFVAVPLTMGIIHLGGRLMLRWLRGKGRNTRSAIIVGTGDVGRELSRRIRTADWLGIRLLGFFDGGSGRKKTDIDGVPVLGGTDAAREFVVSEGVDLVYLALPIRSEKKMVRLAEDFQDTAALVYLVPDFFVFDLMGAQMQEVAGIPVAALYEPPFYGPSGMVKRMEDIVVATLALLLASPVMILISLAIRFASPGPVIFKQRRYGLHGEKIVIWKFRTMTTCEDGDVVPQARRDDPRVTPLGRFLRRSSLDELPQFINVLQGHMSVVGPRPHAVAHNEQYRRLIRDYMWRHRVKPGITGLAQIRGWRGETDSLEKMKKRVECDLEYIRNWSLWLDLKIILLTLVRGFWGGNAY